jgi:hypothetical protein
MMPGPSPIPNENPNIAKESLKRFATLALQSLKNHRDGISLTRLFGNPLISIHA